MIFSTLIRVSKFEFNFKNEVLHILNKSFVGHT